MDTAVMGAIAMAVSIPISVAYYRSVIKNGNREQRFAEEAKRQGNAATGTCVGTKWICGDHQDGKNTYPAIWVKYEYRVAGRAYYKEVRFEGKTPRCIYIDYPDTVTVYYDPSKPKKAVCDVQVCEYNNRQSGCLGAAALWFAISFVIVHALELLFP